MYTCIFYQYTNTHTHTYVRTTAISHSTCFPVQHIRATSPDILEIRIVGIWSRLAEQVSKEPYTLSKEIYIQSKELNFLYKEPDFYILSEAHTSVTSAQKASWNSAGVEPVH